MSINKIIRDMEIMEDDLSHEVDGDIIALCKEYGV